MLCNNTASQEVRQKIFAKQNEKIYSNMVFGPILFGAC